MESLTHVPSPTSTVYLYQSPHPDQLPFTQHNIPATASDMPNSNLSPTFPIRREN